MTMYISSRLWQPPMNLFAILMSVGYSLRGIMRRFIDDIMAPVPSAPIGPLLQSNGARNSFLVIDASGSMLDDDWPPTRLASAKEAAVAFCSRLANEEQDAQVTVIGYGDDAEVFCQPTPARDLQELKDGIARIECLGGTNFRAGLEEVDHRIRKCNGPCDVVLLSDGHNTGRSPKTMADNIKQKAIISCVGIGGNPEAVDEELMRAIASEHPDGSKRYRWIGDKERLVQHFEKLASRITRG